MCAGRLPSTAYCVQNLGYNFPGILMPHSGRTVPVRFKTAAIGADEGRVYDCDWRGVCAGVRPVIVDL